MDHLSGPQQHSLVENVDLSRSGSASLPHSDGARDLHNLVPQGQASASGSLPPLAVQVKELGWGDRFFNTVARIFGFVGKEEKETMEKLKEIDKSYETQLKTFNNLSKAIEQEIGRKGGLVSGGDKLFKKLDEISAELKKLNLELKSYGPDIEKIKKQHLIDYSVFGKLDKKYSLSEKKMGYFGTLTSLSEVEDKIAAFKQKKSVENLKALQEQKKGLIGSLKDIASSTNDAFRNNKKIAENYGAQALIKDTHPSLLKYYNNIQMKFNAIFKQEVKEFKEGIFSGIRLCKSFNEQQKKIENAIKKGRSNPKIKKMEDEKIAKMEAEKRKIYEKISNIHINEDLVNVLESAFGKEWGKVETDIQKFEELSGAILGKQRHLEDSTKLKDLLKKFHESIEEGTGTREALQQIYSIVLSYAGEQKNEIFREISELSEKKSPVVFLELIKDKFKMITEKERKELGDALFRLKDHEIRSLIRNLQLESYTPFDS